VSDVTETDVFIYAAEFGKKSKATRKYLYVFQGAPKYEALLLHILQQNTNTSILNK
jgi:hypothetical protein